MKLPFVSRKKYEDMVWLKDYWHKQAKFTINIPYMSIDGIREVQIYCEDEAEAKKIMARLKCECEE